MDCRLKLICCTILLQIIITCVTADTVGTAFNELKACPADDADLVTTPAPSERYCAYVCSDDPNCDMFHFNHTTNICYQGNYSSHELKLWTDGPCSSFRDESKAPDKTQEMILKLNLKLLYRFGTHGLVNIVDPSKYKLRSNNVNLDSEGAHFKVGQQSYLIADTPGFENYVTRNNAYSMFGQARYRHFESPTYAEFVQCNMDDFSDYLYIAEGVIRVASYDAIANTGLKSEGHRVVAATPDISLISAGFAFDKVAHSAIYFNGSVSPPLESVNNRPKRFDNSVFQCLMLGSDRARYDYQLNGLLKCFALSTRVLTQAEFMQLENWCL